MSKVKEHRGSRGRVIESEAERIEHEQDVEVGEESPEVDGAEVAAVDELARVISELGTGSGGVVRVDRMRDGPRKGYVYVAELDAAGFSLADLQQAYGGGDYRLTIRNAGGQYVKSGRVSIAEPRSAPTAPQPAEPSQLDKIAAALAKQGEMFERVLTFMLSQQSGAKPDDVRRSLLEDLKIMRDITGGGGQQSGADKLLEVLKMGMDIARDAEGGGDWTTIAGKVLDKLGEPIADTLTALSGHLSARAPAAAARQRQVAPPAAPARVPVAQSPEPPMVQPAPPASRVGGEFMPFDIFQNPKPGVTFLLSRAAAGADPQLYAEVIWDALPDEALPMLERLLAADFVALLAQVDPRVVQHAEWFRALGGLLQQLLRESDADVSGPGAGENAGAGGDATSNPAGA